MNPALQYAAPVFCVAKLESSLAYYRDCLGFAVEFVHGDFYAGIERDGCRIHLKMAECSGQGDAPAGHIDACLGTRDACSLAAQFERRGACFAEPLREMPYGREFYVAIPTATYWHSWRARRHEGGSGAASP